MDDENNTPSETPESEDDVSGFGDTRVTLMPMPGSPGVGKPIPSGPTGTSATDPKDPSPPPPIPTPPMGGGTTDPKEPSAW